MAVMPVLSTGKYLCVIKGYKLCTPSQQEWLLMQICQKDTQIAMLLKGTRNWSQFVNIFQLGLCELS